MIQVLRASVITASYGSVIARDPPVLCGFQQPDSRTLQTCGQPPLPRRGDLRNSLESLPISALNQRRITPWYIKLVRWMLVIPRKPAAKCQAAS